MKIAVHNDKDFAFESEGYCLAFGVFEDALEWLSDWLDEATDHSLRRLVNTGVIRGKAVECLFVPTPLAAHSGVLVVGLGKREKFNPEILRRGGGKAADALKKGRLGKVVFDAAMHEGLLADSFLEGLLLGQYAFDHYKSKDDASPKPVMLDEFHVIARTEDVSNQQSRCEYAHRVCGNANWARDLAHLGSNDLTPASLADKAKAMAKEVKCHCEILDEDRMRKLGMNLLLGVARGSDKRANLIALKYTHKDARKTIAIVGKGVTFDTGGVSIKPGDGMHEMKFDMCGAAAVLAAMKTICELQPAVNVVCVVPAVENAIGSSAQTPGEIVKAYNGKTVEILNTDAEGRLILADAIAWTIDHYKPDVVVNVATLTGAILVALGHYAAGLFSNDDALSDELKSAADTTGERIWPFPMWDDYSKMIEGTHGDLGNIGPARLGSAIVAAAFIKEFVGETRWAHLDIAGTAWGAKNIPYWNTDHASGWGVRLLTRWILDNTQSK
jgi:leucyl aminopeptidase